MIDFGRRAEDPELLDEGVPEAEALRSLGDLRLVNRWLGGQRSLLRAVAPFVAERKRSRLLDVGCGSADLPGLLVERSGGRVQAFGVDLKLLHVQQAPPGVHRVVADVRQLPFAPLTFDVVTASLFLHHFDGPEVAATLRVLYALARRALVVNDLERARVPHTFARIVFPWVFRSKVSVSDGLLSIRRAFTADELRAAFEEAGLPQVRITKEIPYRLVAVAERPAVAAP